MTRWLVTGCSTGIGREIARCALGAGHRVLVTSRRTTDVEDLVAEFPGLAVAQPLDVTDRSAIDAAVAAADAAFGGVDVLVNNAGYGYLSAVEEGDDAEVRRLFDTNYFGAVDMIKAVLPQMRARKWGRIINITGSMEPRATNGATAAKAAVHMWSKGLSCDLAAEGITVNCIPPGRINSEQILSRLHPTEAARREFIERHIPIGYFGEPEDIGYLVAFLSSPLARYITGAVVPVDGGMHAFQRGLQPFAQRV